MSDEKRIVVSYPSNSRKQREEKEKPKKRKK